VRRFNREALALRMLLNDVANIAQCAAGLHQLLLIQLCRDLHQALSAPRVADKKHFAGIAVIAIFDHRDIDIDDVAELNTFFFRPDTVANNVIYRGADAFWLESRDSLLEAGIACCINNIVMADLVDLIGVVTLARFTAGPIIMSTHIGGSAN
jgi:hypothetical protein